MDDGQISDAVGARISDVLGSAEEMVTKWLAVVEIVDTEGRRWIRTLTSNEAKAWDNLGLLTFALQYEQAAAVHDTEG